MRTTPTERRYTLRHIGLSLGLNLRARAATALLGAALSTATLGIVQVAHAADDLSDGEVRKLDRDGGRITLKHGEIKSLDMPGMTMVFTAKDKTMLDPLKVGDKVKFAVLIEGGKMMLTRLELAAP